MPTRAIFRVSGRLAVVVLERQRLEYPLAKIEISPRSSTGGFALRLPGGGLFRPNDPASLEALVDRRLTGNWARRMVTSPPGVLSAYIFVVVVAAFSSALMQRDHHQLYHHVAEATHPDVVRQVSDRILVTLELQTQPLQEASPEKNQRMERVLASLPDELANRVQATLYRAFPNGVGPDLLVLPDGRLVVCEGLLAALPNDQELRALLILQLTALKLDHLMEEFVRDAPLPWLIQNSSGLGKLAISINPTLPTLSAVPSIRLEEEDNEAIAAMMQAGIDPRHLLNALDHLKQFNELKASKGRWATAQTLSIERRKRFEAASELFVQTSGCRPELGQVRCASIENFPEEARAATVARSTSSPGSVTKAL